MAHSDKEVAAKIKKTNASEVCKPIPYTPDEALGLYVDGGFSKRSYKLMQTYAYCKEDSWIGNGLFCEYQRRSNYSMMAVVDIPLIESRIDENIFAVFIVTLQIKMRNFILWE